MDKYTIIIEKTDTGYSAYAPDLPGCITVGDTPEEVEKHMKEAISLYIESLAMDGKPVPKPTTMAQYVHV